MMVVVVVVVVLEARRGEIRYAVIPYLQDPTLERITARAVVVYREVLERMSLMHYQ